MPNDSLEQIIKKDDEYLPLHDKGIVSNNVVLAGLAVRHKLLPHRYLLFGFIVEDYHLNENNFKVQGSKIEYKNSYDNNYNSNNKIIYNKILIDGKKEPSSKYFESETTITFRNNDLFWPLKKAFFDTMANKFYWENPNNNNWDFGSKFEYYLFETTTSAFPECAANRVYALCKYYEEGEFKYSIFNLHEILPE